MSSTVLRGLRTLAIFGLFLLLLMLSGMFLRPLTATAAGSNGPLPYSVTDMGVQLPSGATFEDGGHVNVQSNQGDKGVHFEALNDQPSGVWIGESFLPWSAFGYSTDECLIITWVQVSLYNEHFGEGGQEPLAINCDVPEPPVVEPPVVEPPVVEPPVVEPPVEEPPVVEPPVVTPPDYNTPDPIFCANIWNPGWTGEGPTADEYLNCGCPPVPEGREAPEIYYGECPSVPEEVVPTPTVTSLPLVIDATPAPAEADGTVQLAETGGPNPINVMLMVGAVIIVIIVGAMLVSLVFRKRP